MKRKRVKFATVNRVTDSRRRLHQQTLDHRYHRRIHMQDNSSFLHIFFTRFAALSPSSELAHQLLVTSETLPHTLPADRQRLQVLLRLLHGIEYSRNDRNIHCSCKKTKQFSPRVLDKRERNANRTCILLLIRTIVASGIRRLFREILSLGNDDLVEEILRITWKMWSFKKFVKKCSTPVEGIEDLIQHESNLYNGNIERSRIHRESINADSLNDWNFEGFLHCLRDREALTPKCLDVLFEIIVDRVRLVKQKRSDIYSSEIKNIVVLNQVLTVATNHSVETSLHFLRRFSALLMQTSSNIEILLRQKNWQDSIGSFYSGDYIFFDLDIDPRHEEEIETEIFKYTSALFTLIHSYHFERKKGGFRSLMRETKEALIRKFDWGDECGAIYRALLFTLIKRVQASAVTMQSNYTLASWDNTVKLMDLVEHFIFFDPYSEGKITINDNLNKTALVKSMVGGAKARRKLSKNSKKATDCGFHLYKDGTAQDLILVVEIVKIFEQCINLSYLNPSVNFQMKDNERLITIGKRLWNHYGFFQEVKKLLECLDKKEIERFSSMLSEVSASLIAKRGSKFTNIFISSVKLQSQFQNQLELQIVEPMIKIKECDVRNSVKLKSDNPLENSARGFVTTSAAQRYCMEKRAAILKTDPEAQALESRSRARLDRAKPGEKDVTLEAIYENIRADEGPQFASASEDGSYMIDEKEDEAYYDFDESKIDAISENGFLSGEEEFQEVQAFWAKVVEDFVGEDEGELSATNGSIVEVINTEDEDWWLCAIEENVGYIPASYIESIESYEPEDEDLDMDVEEVFRDKPDLSILNSQILEIVDEYHQISDEESVEDDELPPLICTFCRIELSHESFFEHGIQDNYDLCLTASDGLMCCENCLIQQFYTCISCKLKIEGPYFYTTSGKIHPGCSRCAVDNEPLKEGEVSEKNGKLYCDDHFWELFGLMCYHCKETIRGPAIEAMGKHFHKDHFICTSCTNPIEGDFYENDEMPYCVPCYTDIIADKCVLCNLAVLDSAVRVGSFLYHTDCIFCQVCNIPYSMGFIPTREDEKFDEKHTSHTFLCATHALEAYTEVCARCSENIGILDQRSTVADLVYHVHCLHCDICKVTLVGEEVFNVEGKIYCRKHYEKEAVPKCSKCSFPLESGNAVEISGSFIHKHCVRCEQCDRELIGTNFGIHSDGQGGFLCKQHYVAQNATICGLCKEPLISDAVGLGELKVHKQCVKCADCGRSLLDGKLGLHQDANGVLMCREDYIRANAKVCMVCNQPVLGPALQVQNYTIDADCFNCNICQTDLRGVQFRIQQNALFCANC